MTDHHHPPLDFSCLIEMVGDDPVFLADFFKTFVDHIPVYLAEMENAFANGNWSKVSHCAHKMKPTFSYIGRNDVKQLVEAIEKRAQNNIGPDKIQSDIEKLKLICADICTQLEKEKLKLSAKQ